MTTQNVSVRSKNLFASHKNEELYESGAQETHILRPSPYFTGQFLTTHTSRCKTVSLDGRVIKTVEGFDQEVTAKVLSEEIGYNKDYKPFRILVIDQPLDPQYQNPAGNLSNDEGFLTVRGGFDECKNFLNLFPAYHNTINSLDQSIMKFNTNYMVLTDYLDDASKRLQSLCSQTVEKCLGETSLREINKPQFSDVLNVSVQGYTMRKVHRKVFSAICEKFQHADCELFEKCERLREVNSGQLGVQDEFTCPLPSAVDELANLDNLKTPFEKIKCVKSTLDQIAEGVNDHVLKNRHPSMSSNDVPCLTTDDLIPILVTVLAQAGCEHIQSNVFYLENFYWPASSKNDISYSLVTFKAAVEYMRATDFSSLLSFKNSHKKEAGIDSLLTGTEKMGLSEGGNDSVQSASPGASLSRIDRQLMRISKMLEDSSSEWTKAQQKAPPKSIFANDSPSRGASASQTSIIFPKQDSKRKKQQLGDFLSSLQDDVFDTSFGKQS
ncbi:uncharacterized protein LOC135476973 [Liolophura sinensis]|uniref:uncharacterized protein LOC135476973 n=1 Tax=Liolophura sinensis TaxID=3198878 RepID=UPI0031598A0C